MPGLLLHNAKGSVTKKIFQCCKFHTLYEMSHNVLNDNKY
jgi:hypothetical protein